MTSVSPSRPPLVEASKLRSTPSASAIRPWFAASATSASPAAAKEEERHERRPANKVRLKHHKDPRHSVYRYRIIHEVKDLSARLRGALGRHRSAPEPTRSRGEQDPESARASFRLSSVALQRDHLSEDVMTRTPRSVLPSWGANQTQRRPPPPTRRRLRPTQRAPHTSLRSPL